MSQKENQEYLEDMKIKFEDGDENVREAVIEELRMNNYLEEADELELQEKESSLNYGADKDNFE